MKKIFRSRIFRIILSIALSLIFLYLAFRNIDLTAVAAAVKQASPFWILLALVMVGGNLLSKIFRWQVLLGPPGRQVRFTDVGLALLSGQMLNTLLPVRVGDFSRAYTVGELGPGKTFTFGTVVLEKILDLIWYGLVLLILMALIPLPGWLNDSAIWLSLITVVTILTAFLVAYKREQFMRLISYCIKWLPKRWEAYLLSHLRAGLESLNVIQNPADLLAMTLWSAGVWVTAVLINYFCLLALDIHIDFSANLLLLVVLQVGISFTNIPGRIGIFEYLCILVLSYYGIGQVQALAYGLLLHAIAMGIPTLLGIIAFWILGVRGQRPGLSDSIRQA